MNKIAFGDYALSSGPSISIDGWEFRHLVSIWMMATLSIVSAFWSSDQWILFSAVYSGGTAFALFTAQTLRVSIYDALIQFHYREKFGLFLFHIAVMATPSLFGLDGWHHALSALLVLLCFQAVHIPAMGRIYVASLLLAIISLLTPPLPPFFLTAGWMLFLLVAIRFEHLRFRLEHYGRRRTLPAGETIRETAGVIMIPWLSGVALYALFAVLFEGQTRRLEFHGGLTVATPQSSSAVGPVSMSEALFEGVILAGLIIASLVLLHWLEKKLRGKQKPNIPEGEQLLDAEEEYENFFNPDDDEVASASPTDARGRIISGFKDFASELAKLGYERHNGETAHGYMTRVGTALLKKESIPAPLPRNFNRACYSPETISEEQAREFIESVRTVEPLLRNEIAKRKNSEEAAPSDS